MTFFEYLSIFRRRWFYLAVGMLAGGVAGFLTAPGESDEPVEFTATHTLLVEVNTPSGAALNLDQSGLLATTGPVPERVAARLEGEGLPAVTDIDAVPNLTLRSLKITATSPTAAGATRAADLTAEEVNADLVAVDKAAYEQQLKDARDQITQTETELRDVDGQLAPLAEDDPARVPLQDERSSISASLVDYRAQVESLEAQGAPAPPLRTLEAAKASQVGTEGWRLPESRPARGVMLGVFGLLLGAVGALAADRLDTRVRGKDDAERAFGLPVVAEIPPLAGGAKNREMLVATRPASPFVEAYRALRTVVLFAASGDTHTEVPAGIEHTNGSGPHEATVILVTSPSAGEGKTTTAAHLAAVLAEVGKRTLVISADFRRPRIHEYFGVPREPGLSDVLDSGTGRVRVSDLQMATSFSGVHLLPSGGPVDNPAQLLTESAQLIAAARRLFDYIVIDTPPILVANDATELAAAADMVLLVARADRTSRSASQRATEILRRVEAPLLGVVVAAAHDTPTAYGYYRYRYYSESDQSTGGRRLLQRKDKAIAEPVGAVARQSATFDEA